MGRDLDKKRVTVPVHKGKISWRVSCCEILVPFNANISTSLKL
jgi:hypothetical protein